MNLLEKILPFHKRNRWLTHLLFWLALLLISISSSKYQDGKQGSYGFELMSDGLYELTEIAAAYFLTYVVVPLFFYQKKYFRAIAAFVAASYLICVTARIINVKICEPIAGIAPKAFETYREISTDILKLLYIYFFQIISVALVFMILKVLMDQLDIHKRALSLEKEKAKTELKLLKTQLNPHFLFNTLNNIYSLSFTSSPATSESIARLADILDHMLYRCDAQYVPLSAEIALLRNYIELEKLRYDKRLTVNFQVQTDQQIVIAPLILLSLVENAFKHGVSEDAGAPAIDIVLEVNELNFVFNISNSVADQKNEIGNSPNDRIGLNNLRKQLDLIYGEDYTLDVARRNKTFEVSLMIDLKHRTAIYEKNQVLAS